MLKERLRSAFPAFYNALWRVKEFLRTGTFNRQWEKYYAAREAWLLEPSPVLIGLKLPTHINTMLDIGCGSGRNFVPFDGTLKLWGIDIVRENHIHWVRPFKQLTYERLAVEELTKRLERGDVDLSHTFVFEHGTLMYVSEEYQNRFFKACKQRGCRNFLFIDYPRGMADGCDLKISAANFTVTDHPTDKLLKVYRLMEER